MIAYPFHKLECCLVTDGGGALILNLPGSERGATENLEVVLPVLAHAVAQLREAPEERPPAGTHAG